MCAAVWEYVVLVGLPTNSPQECWFSYRDSADYSLNSYLKYQLFIKGFFFPVENENSSAGAETSPLWANVMMIVEEDYMLATRIKETNIRRVALPYSSSIFGLIATATGMSSTSYPSNLSFHPLQSPCDCWWSFPRDAPPSRPLSKLRLSKIQDQDVAYLLGDGPLVPTVMSL